MNKDEAVAAVLSKALEVANTTGEFVVEQAPDVVNQLVSYYTALYGAGLIAGIVLLTLAIILFIKGWRNNEWEDVRVVLSLFLAMPGLALGIVNTLSLLKIMLAPKIWLMEYAASLIK